MNDKPKPTPMKLSDFFRQSPLVEIDLERDPSPRSDIDYLFPHVERVECLGDYRLRITFQSGTIKDVDLVGELHGEVFESLSDPSFFQHVYVNHEWGTIEWPNGADFTPELLYDIGQRVQTMR